jgi:hypothetical protein
LPHDAQIVAVLVISTRCPIRPELLTTIERMKLTLARRAQATGRSFSAVAVVLDWSDRNAMRFINRFGRFDELILGGNWLNSGTVQWIWRGVPGVARVPQVVVVERPVRPLANTIVVGSERELVRRVNNEEILAWGQQNFPLLPLAPNAGTTSVP